VTYEELLRRYLEYDARADPAEQAAFNKIKEELGEQLADRAIAEKYGERAKARAVPRRGEKGAPMLDRLFELDPERAVYAVEGELVVVESKFAQSELGRTNFTRRFLVEPSGSMVPVPLKKQVTQLDADWMRARIREIAGHERAAGVAESESLAGMLDRAAQEGRLRVLEIRSDVVVENGRIVGVTHQTIDHTADVAKDYRTGRRPPKDAEARFAAAESLDELYLKRATKQAKGDAETLKKVQRRLGTAQGRVADADAALKNLAPGAKPSEKRRLEKRLADNQQRLTAVEQEAANARTAAQRSEELRQAHEETRDANQAKRKAEAFKKRQAKKTAEAVTRDARAVAGTATADRDVSRTLADGAKTARTERTAAKAAEVVKTGERIVTGARPLRAAARFALRGARGVLVTGGKFAFRVLEFANPVLDVLMLVDAIDWVVDWLQREEQEERAEWKRIAHALSAPAATVRLEPYGVPYTDGYGEAFGTLVEHTLAGEFGSGSFIDWLRKWDAEPGWHGFVYATATGAFERQQLHGGDYPIPVAYYITSPPPTSVSLSDRPPPNWKRAQGGPGTVGDADDRNRRTPRRGPFGGPVAHEFVDVDISMVEFRYTFPDPVLTPFDFLLAKCHALNGEILAFLARYDSRIDKDMEVYSEILPGVRENWLKDFPFEYPLYGETIQWCLRGVDQATLLLETHGPRQGDERRPEPAQPYSAGYHRRLQILHRLKGSGTPKMWSFADIGGKLPEMLQDANAKYLVDAKDKDAAYLTPKYLHDVAHEIHADVTRAFEACRASAASLHYNFEGPPSPAK
jgi:hypothetical protein